MPVVFDVNLRPTLWSDLASARPACEQVAQRSTLVKLSLDDANGLYGSSVTPDAAIETMLNLGASAVVLTDGERGCWFSSGSPATFVPAFPVEAVEPTGAGDAFTAAIIARSLARTWAPLSSQMCDMPRPQERWPRRDQGRGMGCRIAPSSTRLLRIDEAPGTGRWCC